MRAANVRECSELEEKKISAKWSKVEEFMYNIGIIVHNTYFKLPHSLVTLQ